MCGKWFLLIIVELYDKFEIKDKLDSNFCKVDKFLNFLFSNHFRYHLYGSIGYISSSFSYSLVTKGVSPSDFGSEDFFHFYTVAYGYSSVISGSVFGVENFFLNDFLRLEYLSLNEFVFDNFLAVGSFSMCV